MTLESIAQTTVQIRYETGANSVFNAIKWVPLEEAQKLEELAEGAVKNNLTLREKIAEANKILEVFPTKISVMSDVGRLTMPYQPIDEIVIWLMRLREVLSR